MFQPEYTILNGSFSSLPNMHCSYEGNTNLHQALNKLNILLVLIIRGFHNSSAELFVFPQILYMNQKLLISF